MHLVWCVLWLVILKEEIKGLIIDNMFIIVVVLYCHEEAVKPHSSTTMEVHQQFLWQVFSPKLYQVE